MIYLINSHHNYGFKSHQVTLIQPLKPGKDNTYASSLKHFEDVFQNAFSLFFPETVKNTLTLSE